MRITKKRKNGFYELKAGAEIYGEENGIRLVQIVGQLEDINEKLGIGVIPLLTALTKGYAFWKNDDDDFIYKVEVRYITNCSLKVNTWYYADYNKNGKKYSKVPFDGFLIGIEDYGKTWALTKEELL